MPFKFAPHFPMSLAAHGADLVGVARRALRVRPLGLGLAGALTLATGLAHAYPVNHVYISIKGSPTYAVTIKFFDATGRFLYQRKNTMRGTKRSYEYSPPVASVQLSISSLYSNRYSFNTSDVAYDHCIRMNPLGSSKYMGDNRTGCNGK